VAASGQIGEPHHTRFATQSGRIVDKDTHDGSGKGRVFAAVTIALVCDQSRSEGRAIASDY